MDVVRLCAVELEESCSCLAPKMRCVRVIMIARRSGFLVHIQIIQYFVLKNEDEDIPRYYNVYSIERYSQLASKRVPAQSRKNSNFDPVGRVRKLDATISSAICS